MINEEYLNLGELVDELAKYKAHAPLMIASPNRLAPTGHFHMYRGYYEDLAIDFAVLPDRRNPPLCVGQFLDVLSKQVGRIYPGWKGNEYLISNETRIWISNPGLVSTCRVTGLDEDEGVVYITYAMRMFRGNTRD